MIVSTQKRVFLCLVDLNCPNWTISPMFAARFFYFPLLDEPDLICLSSTAEKEPVSRKNRLTIKPANNVNKRY